MVAVKHLTRLSIFPSPVGLSSFLQESQAFIDALRARIAFLEEEHAREKKREIEKYDLARRAGRLGVWRWERSTDVVEWSPEIEEFLGMPRGSFEGTFQSFLNLVHPDDHALIQRLIAASFEDGSNYNIELRMFRSDGGICWVRGQGQVLRDVTGPIGLLGAVWEITAQKQADSDVQFLLDLSSRFSQTVQPEELLETASTALKQRLAVPHCRFSEIDLKNEVRRMMFDFDGDPSPRLRTLALKSFGPAALEAGRLNKILAVADVMSDPRTARNYQSTYLPLGVRSLLCVPLHRGGQWMASLSVSSPEPRIWTDPEARLLQAVAERLWPAYDNAQLLRLTRETAERLQLAQTAAKSVFWDWNVKTGQTTYSPGYFDLFGNPDVPAALPYDAWLALIHPDDRSGLKDAIECALGGTGEYEREFRVVWPEGSTHWLVARGRVSFDTTGQPEQVVTVNWDATQRKQAAEALRRSTQQFAATFEQAAVGIAHVGLDGTFLAVNQRLADMLGYTREELAGRKSQEITYPDDLAVGLAEYEALKRSQAPSYSLEKRYIHKDGRSVWINLTVALVRDSGGAPVHAISVIQDITERHRMEQELRESREAVAQQFAEIEALYSTAPVGLAFIDTGLRFVRINQKMAEMNGWPAAEHLGRTIQEILPEFCPQMGIPLQQAIDSGQPILEMEIEGVTRAHGGQKRTWLVNHFPLQDQQGRVLGVNSVVQDITELREQRQRLEQNESQLLMALDASKLGLWSRDLQSDQVTLSERAASILGLEPGLIPSDAWRQLLHPEDRLCAICIEKAALAGKDEFAAEYRLIRPDGTLIWISSPGKMMRDYHGEPLRMIGVIQDITGRKLHEQALKDREEQLRAMVDSMTQLAWIAHPDGQIFWYNRRWYEYTGTTPEQMAGWGWQSVHDPDVLPSVMEVWNKARRDGETFEMEFPLRGHDGAMRWFLTRVAPVRDAHGRVERWFGTNTDVDTLRRAQSDLRDSEQHFRELAETVPDIVWSSTADGSVDYFNSQWYRFTGQTPETSLGTGWMAALHPEDLERCVELWTRAMASGKHYTVELRLRRHNGAFCWYLGRGRAMLDDAGKIRKWFGSYTEVDEQKRIEAELRRSNEDLRQFAYAASHDLQEPLRMVSIYTDLLGRQYRGQLDAQADQFIEYAVEGATRMNRLLRGLLEYTQTGDQTTPALLVKTEFAMQQAIEMLDIAIQDSGAVITYDALPQVRMPETQLLQLFQNLIGNGIKYRGQQPPQVHVSAARRGHFWCFSVQDNGIGIPPEYADQIFGVFKRLHKTAYPGTGIGLAICKRVVERAGGRIWVESNPGMGATFYFTLPDPDL